MDSPEFESRQKQTNFFSSDSEAHPASYSLETRSSFSRANWPDSAVDYIIPSSAERRKYIYIYMVG